MNEKLIEEFCLGYYGYGNMNADYWFIGMEEGGDNSVKDFYENYVEKWNKKESTYITNGTNEYAERMFFGEGANTIQKTWGGIIQILLAIEGKAIDRESVLNFQKENLGRQESNNLLLELSPLPSRSTSNWKYGTINLPHFVTRTKFLNYYSPKRIKRIKELIAEYNPKVVVFYSKKYKYYWKEIMGVNNEISITETPIKINRTLFLICNHPAYRYNKEKEYYPNIGNRIRNQL